MIQANGPIVPRNPQYVPQVEAMFSDRLSTVFLREAGKTRPVSCDELEARFGVDYLGDVLDNESSWVEFSGVEITPAPVEVKAGESRLHPVFAAIFDNCFGLSK
jgi:hypothetical protein